MYLEVVFLTLWIKYCAFLLSKYYFLNAQKPAEQFLAIQCGDVKIMKQCQRKKVRLNNLPFFQRSHYLLLALSHQAYLSQPPYVSCSLALGLKLYILCVHKLDLWSSWQCIPLPWFQYKGWSIHLSPGHGWTRNASLPQSVFHHSRVWSSWFDFQTCLSRTGKNIFAFSKENFAHNSLWGLRLLSSL